jgi:hypothetical protein
MEEKRFWDIIAAGCNPEGDVDDWHEGLVAELVKLSPEEILLFDCLFDERTDAAYSHDLWGAAYFINGGASDDGFYYFRCWLVGMGKKVYDAALKDPDSLADVVRDDEEYEAEIYSVGMTAWRKLGLTDDAYDKAIANLRRGRKHPKLRGRRWNFENDKMKRKKFPRLSAIYLFHDNDDPDEDE